MKTTKLVIGILSIALTFIVLFQSCAAGIGDALAESGGFSGASGMLVAILMLVSGIVAIAARKRRGGSIACLILYALAGVVGLLAHGIFKDLAVWGGFCALFAVFFLIDTITFKKPQAPSSL